MKKLIAGLVLALSAAMAFALPSPKQIEHALAAGDFQSAQSMTQEVLREKPDSPKAHLFNAYLLVKRGNKVAASEELNNVNRLDHTDGHVVKNSSLYGRTVAELGRSTAPVARVQPRQGYVAATPVVTPTVQYSQPVAAPVKSGIGFFGWMMILLGIAIIAYMIYAAIMLAAERKAEKERQERIAATYRTVAPRFASGGVVPADLSAAYEPAPRRLSNHGRTYDATPHPVYPASPAPQASTVVVNNSGDHSSGLLQGMMLNEMMHSHHHNSHSERVIEREYVAPAPEYEPVRETVTPTYETEAASFSSGSDDDWDSKRSSSSSSDSWGSSSSSSSSSSYDSGSSSSDWGGSSDSGSSGGSDW